MRYHLGGLLRIRSGCSHKPSAVDARIAAGEREGGGIGCLGWPRFYQAFLITSDRTV